MSETTSSNRPEIPMTCDEANLLLADHLDGTLAASERLALDAHLVGCGECRVLVSELATIVADAKALPTLAPSRDLWSGIADRIATPVIALGDAPRALAHGVRHARGDHRPSTGFNRYWLGAAAALVLITAGVTHLATRAAFDRPAVDADSARLASATVDTPNVERRAPSVETAPRPEPSAERREPSATAVSTLNVRRSTLHMPRSENAESSATLTYDRQIGALRRIVEQRRDQVDSTTLAVLERNLRIIDAAISESRAALARDSRSAFLRQQLDRALDHKVELLRTAALLPSRI
jgi:hypothetical protein